MIGLQSVRIYKNERHSKSETCAKSRSRDSGDGSLGVVKTKVNMDRV
jgi:hypothetical protein